VYFKTFTVFTVTASHAVPVLHYVLNYWQELSSCWDGRPFAHNRHGPKNGRGLLCPFPWEGELPKLGPV